MINEQVTTRDSLEDFVRESNRIEGILRDPTKDEIDYTRLFLQKEVLTLDNIEILVSIYQPDGILRRYQGMNVRVGSHYPPEGGPCIPIYLERILSRINGNLGYSPYQAHCDYEILHPFSDGNGRSGRAIWAWHMKYHNWDPFALPFLHSIYYQALSEARQMHI